ncbi:MAG TPA: hypothetical protein VJ248_08480 [Candidatus Udaeobacter sp.]|nr:hypothetical protein [Candidatus Udaeobacter sp.]
MMIELDAAHACVFKALRNVFEYTLAELARAIHTTAPTLFTIESAIEPVRKNKQMVMDLCQQFDITFEQFDMLAAYVRKVGIIEFHKQTRGGFVSIMLDRAFKSGVVK